jgi:50S ribosomal subunit-associated GTPase HflX
VVAYYHETLKADPEALGYLEKRGLGSKEAIDRFQLILEIFTKRASTKEAQLQVQLANLRYQLPRARESVRLARTGEQPGLWVSADTRSTHILRR